MGGWARQHVSSRRWRAQTRIGWLSSRAHRARGGAWKVGRGDAYPRPRPMPTRWAGRGIVTCHADQLTREERLVRLEPAHLEDLPPPAHEV